MLTDGTLCYNGKSRGRAAKTQMTGWYERSFGPDYLIVYRHRDFAGARVEVRGMLRLLDLPEGASVLDLCCGTGRHALALAEAGYRVTGVDLSETLLKEASRRDAAGKVRWVRGDMRAVPLDGPFDAVVNWFTSFGYFESDEDNGRVLHEIERLLRPGGRWLIDFLNPDRVLASLVPHSVRRDGGVWIEERRFSDGRFVFKTIRLSEPGKPDRTYEERIRLYRLDDFQRLLAGTQLVVETVCGDYDGSAYDRLQSPRLILIGSKRAVNST